MILSKIVISTLRFVAILLTISPQNVPGKTSPRVEISYKLEERNHSVHEPIMLRFKVHNGLPDPIVLHLGVNGIQFFEFKLRTTSGQVLHGKSQPGDGLSRQPDEVPISSGRDYEAQILLNRWFDFDEPGGYSLSANLATFIEVKDGSRIAPQAQLLELVVAPRNANRLRRVCSDLVYQISQAKSVETEQEPALRLGHMKDPIAVPYLARVLAQHMFNYPIAISGLQRIGNDAAAENLLSLLDDRFGDISLLSRQALSRIQDQISDARLRAAVKRALATNPSPPA